MPIGQLEKIHNYCLILQLITSNAFPPESDGLLSTKSPQKSQQHNFHRTISSDIFKSFSSENKESPSEEKADESTAAPQDSHSGGYI